MAERIPALAAAPKSWRRLAYRLLGRKAEIVYGPNYGRGASTPPRDPLRGERILTHLLAGGLLRADEVRTPRSVSLRSLRRVHTDAYLESLDDPRTLTRIMGMELPAELQDDFVTVQRSMVGGTILAAELARESGGIAVNLGGGLHHALADRGQGFCIFNDVAVAVSRLRSQGFVGKILVIDLDLHDGDGTRSIFASDPTVHTFSICSRFWGPTQAEASTDIALGHEVEDSAYLDALEAHLPPIVKRFRPDLVFYLAGCDPAGDDEIGDWKISAEGMLDRDRFVIHQLRGLHRRPLVVLLAGGYGGEAWRYTARFLAWYLSAGRRLEPPSTEEITLLRYRHLTEVLSRQESFRRELRNDDWAISERELALDLGGFGSSTRFLDRYSKHAVELALESLGIFERLRALGFRHPVIDFDLDNPSGHTIRLFSDRSRRELLAELRARKDRSTLPDREMLRIEWLLLQNPRTRFIPGRAPLPGQQHPGLGLLRDIVALLVVVAERLHLDGLLFVPSHYHMAITSRKYLRFVDPEDEGRLRALERALEGLSLAEATAAVHRGRVRHASNRQSYRWKPAPMVLPLSRELRRDVRSGDYERRALEAAAGLDLALGAEDAPPP